MALQVAKPIGVLARVAGVLVCLLVGNAQQLRHIVAKGDESGIFSETAHTFIDNLFDVTHSSAREVVVTRARMVACNLHLPKGGDPKRYLGCI